MMKGRGNNRGGAGGARPPTTTSTHESHAHSSMEILLPVLDMGLDFRSYQTLQGGAALGNVVSYAAHKVPDIFEPTVGLLVTILHLYAQGTTVEEAVIWLHSYETIQRLFLEVRLHDDKSKSGSDVSACEEALKLISLHRETTRVATPDNRLWEKLLGLLDAQSGICGGQAPSQRRIPRDPKGTFCNLHLSDHRCNQEFTCNQLHLHQAGSSVKHRRDFNLKMINILVKESTPMSEIVHRVKDSLFYAKYGNKVTVRFHNGSIPFFKTIFTMGRLGQALRQESHVCACRGPTGTTSCLGVHIQDERNISYSKSMDLLNANEVHSELEIESGQLLLIFESSRINMTSLLPPPLREMTSSAVELKPSSTTSTSSTNKQQNLLDSPTLLPKSNTIKDMNSPTTLHWNNTVREYVRTAGISDHPTDVSLIRTLQGLPPHVVVTTPLARSGATPHTPSERFSPLLHEVDLQRFNADFATE